MRVLIATAGSHGDVLPFVALGREFAARGHEVIFYVNPFFLSYTTDSAIRFVPISTVEKYSSLFGELSDADPTRAFKRVATEYAATCPEYYRAMKTDVIPCKTITICNSLLFSHRLLRETDRVPCATVHLAPSVFRSNVRPARLVPNWITSRTPSLLKRAAWWMLDKTFYDPNFTVPLNKYRAELGLPSVNRIFRSWIHEADCVVGLFPDWFGEPQSDWPDNVTLADFPLYDHGNRISLSPSLDEFISDGQPPVAFSAGTATATAHEFFKTSVEASEAAGLRAILLTHFRQQVPASLPKNAIHVDYAPFGSLLPKLAAFVHHGGIGSTSQALRAGVPQLIRPVAYDQFDNSAHAVRLGVAQEILPKHYVPHVVAGTLNKLTSDSTLNQRCQQVATRFTICNSIVTACDTILSRLCGDAQPCGAGDAAPQNAS
jgi:UDP:flavonoid glycosyltransferase YjiC (YdhE family)